MADDGAAQKKTPGEKSSPAEKDSEDSPLRLVTVDGDVFMRFPITNMSIADHVRSIRNMPMREDDIVIAAFPKCGTHWIWEVTQMLTKGKAEHDPLPKEMVMVEFNPVEVLEPVPSPRVINSHLFLRQLSKEVVTKRSRIIHVIRNPKDVAVSLYFHMLQIKGFKDDGVLDLAKGFLHGGISPGSYFDYFAYMKEMTQWQREHPEVPVINIYYEDVKKDPVKCVRQLAEFLKVDASDQLCEDIADQCSFKKLKQADETVKVKDTTPDRHIFKGGVSKLYRKGEVGDWKNYFTVALSEEFDRVVPENLKGCDLKIQYTI
ncbi:sulfotransferase 1A1-like isoform X2 [Littorina saxatilis]|uniref:sulfotransferase 1A1-like isoform X2 n=1 Tax=Littorina saxatilis TaxID=31220 RepID=UPI0038B5A52F